MSDVVVIGAGGLVKLAISTLRANNHSVSAVFDDDESRWCTEILGVPVRGPVAAAAASGCEFGVVAISQNDIRKTIANSLNLEWLVLVHPAAYVAFDTKLGAGTIVCAGAAIQPGSVLGAHVIVSTGATIDHGCTLESFTHVGPGVHLAGNVHVSEGASIAIGSTVIPGKRVGAWARVGGGAVLVRNLLGDQTAYGVPAMPKQRIDRQLVHEPHWTVLHTEQQREWMAVLEQTIRHDFYHLPQYHRLHERRGDGKAQLFVYRNGAHLIALPLLLRAVNEADPNGWIDATSAYGYCGPLASSDIMPDSVLKNFQITLCRILEQRRVVAAFSRLHPLIGQSRLLDGLGERQVHGRTVSIDMTLPLEQQWNNYRRSCRTRINKLQREGVVCVRDADKCHLAEFVDIYEQTMRRVNAPDSYFFGPDYFTELASGLGSSLQLFVVLAHGKVAAGGLFTICDTIVQYHLGGTRDAFLKLSPTGLMFDTVRRWATENGARVLHLGGGVGSKDDSLFHFKAGFSDCRHEFSTWRWIIDPDAYHDLCDERLQLIRRQGLEPVSSDFFPAYRCPAAAPIPFSSPTQRREVIR